jgi:hypothetical protein
MYPIIIHPLFVCLALLLLWFPRQWLRLGASIGRRARDASAAARKAKLSTGLPEDHDNRSVKLGSELRKRRNYFDLFRAGAGSFALANDSFTIAPKAPPHTAYHVMLIVGLIAIIGVLIQIVRYRDRLDLFAPIFYLSGLSIGLCGVQTGAFALVMIWAIGFTMASPEGFLTCYAAVIGGFSYFFLDSQQLIVAGIVCLLVFLPTLLGLLMQRSLVMSASITREQSREMDWR